MTEDTAAPAPYRVLARKYRPGHFRDLIGQEAMVRTLTNAFERGRIAQAFILTGVRGVGKTTTARIVAKGLNCTARQGPSTDPCGACPACAAIAAGRHVDVIEMDAASNTGVEYVREINEAVRYRPAEVRYKVYIIDEVHMLSTSSFNALLKTLEEPPEHVVFILATTEIRKVPVTVLSRCQRFDLRRIEPEAMMAHLADVARAEGAEIAEGALALITRAAEGSVRDALSLLDQAIRPGAEATDAAAVRAMLGLADRARVIDLFEAVMRGDAPGALEELSRQYAEGADPAGLLRDLAELTHWIAVLRVSPQAAEDPTIGPEERDRGRGLAEALSMRVLTRAWQMLLKALEEVAVAPSAMMAAEMAIIRLAHVAELPPPEELIRQLRGEEDTAGPARGPAPGGQGGGAPRARLTAMAGGRAAAGPAPDPDPGPAPGTEATALAGCATFPEAVEALRRAREIRLATAVESYVELVAYRPGAIEFHPAPGAPENLAGRLSEALKAATGARWSVAVTDAPGAPTIDAQRAAEQAESRSAAAEHPLVRAALEAFPGAEIRAVRPLGPAPGVPAEADILAPAPERDEIEGDLVDTDDPFEEI